jgi:hypothetical protein
MFSQELVPYFKSARKDTSGGQDRKAGRHISNSHHLSIRPPLHCLSVETSQRGHRHASFNKLNEGGLTATEPVYKRVLAIKLGPISRRCENILFSRPVTQGAPFDPPDGEVVRHPIHHIPPRPEATGLHELVRRPQAHGLSVHARCALGHGAIKAGELRARVAAGSYLGRTAG